MVYRINNRLGTCLCTQIVLAMIYMAVAIATVTPIEVTLEIDAGQPIVQDERRIGRYQAGFAGIAWIGPSSLLYGRSPYTWRWSIEQPVFEQTTDVFQRLNVENAGMLAMKDGRGAILFTGKIWEADFFLYIDDELHSITPEESRLLQSDPRVEERRYPDRNGLPDNWRYLLYGGYAIEPGPTRDFEVLDIALYHPDGHLITALPGEFHRLMNFGGYSMVAVTQDRFRIAMIGQVVQRTLESPVEHGWNLFILQVNYDGIINSETVLYTEPGSNCPIGILSEGEEVTVSAADQFTMTEEGVADYWYRVSTGELSGWVFGGNLSIEGGTWEDRLEVRDRPMSAEELIENIRQ